LPESSWGAGGGHFTWMNQDTEWVWTPIHAAERRMEELVARFPDASGDQLQVLNQAARELLLLQSSDWPFLITTGQAKEYATERFNTHTARFNLLAEIAEQNDGLSDDERARVDDIAARDNPFPTIDYRDFAARQGVSVAAPATTG
jgi:1,4-alpha-glucan branching enzyme